MAVFSGGLARYFYTCSVSKRVGLVNDVDVLYSKGDSRLPLRARQSLPKLTRLSASK